MGIFITFLFIAKECKDYICHEFHPKLTNYLFILTGYSPPQ